uniref:Zgc:109986 n=1 Tax=Hucho hucho TaxID=62062 RepID=A0A4W5MST8_9TELE
KVILQSLILFTQTQQNPQPTLHEDAFLYVEETVDTLCEEGKMSRNYCLKCGSHRTAPLEFISHSSILKLQFLFQHVLPVTGRLVMDNIAGKSGYLYSSAARLVGVEISAEFIRLQNMAVEKYAFSHCLTFPQVIHAENMTQDSLLQNADILIMNNVCEYFLQPNDQMNIMHTSNAVLCNVYLGKDGGPDAFKEIHLYRICDPE